MFAISTFCFTRSLMKVKKSFFQIYTLKEAPFITDDHAKIRFEKYRKMGELRPKTVKKWHNG